MSETLYVGDRVLVHAHWHTFCGQRGTVIGICPLKVRIDGDLHPMFFEHRAVKRDEAVSE